MAPRKEVINLFDLAYDSVAKLVVSICIKIDINYNFGEPKWLEVADNLQALLVRSVSPLYWDMLCDKVFSLVDKDDIKFIDGRVLYAVLVHKNMTKLDIQSFSQATKSNFYFSKEHDALFVSNQNFWVGLITKLVNLVELNTNFIKCEELFHAVNNNCVKLEHLTYDNSTNPNFFELLVNCTQLRCLKNYSCIPGYNPFGKQDCTMAQAQSALKLFPNLEDFYYENMVDVFEELDMTGPLNLKRYQQRDQYWQQYPHRYFTSPDVETVIQLCPLLQSLDISVKDRESCKDIFELLAGSELRLAAFNIENFFYDDNVALFFQVNRDSIKTLEFTSHDPNLYYAIVSIGEYCKHLTHLKIADYRKTCNFVKKTDLFLPKPRSMFKNLTTLAYSPNDSWTGTWNIALLCLINSSRVTSFSIINSCGTRSDEPLLQLFNTKWMSHLANLKVSIALSVPVLRHIYDSCPDLTFIELENGVDSDNDCCLNLLQQFINENNLNLTMKY